MLSLSDGNLDVTQRSAARTIDGELHMFTEADGLRDVALAMMRPKWLRTKLIEFGRLMQLNTDVQNVQRCPETKVKNIAIQDVHDIHKDIVPCTCDTS